MIHICRNSHGFYVVVTGSNGESLSTSELLSSKPKAWKNIIAQRKNFARIGDTPPVAVQDDSPFMKVKLYWLRADGVREKNNNNPVPKYIPGKNKKKKK
jgi:hypothetical protein